MALSGSAWVSKFPTSKSVDDLADGFREKVEEFVAALRVAGATISINATRRPRQRAYLMHFSWRIAKNRIAPADATKFRPDDGEDEVDIQWLHKKPSGAPDVAASRAAAKAMVEAYGTGGSTVAPSLVSNHIRGTAIDMSVRWTGTLSIKTQAGATVSITSGPRSSVNPDLIRVGRGYGVKHFSPPEADPPHWSLTGG
jgi:hypothetical protein